MWLNRSILPIQWGQKQREIQIALLLPCHPCRILHQPRQRKCHCDCTILFEMLGGCLCHHCWIQAQVKWYHQVPFPSQRSLGCGHRNRICWMPHWFSLNHWLSHNCLTWFFASLYAKRCFLRQKSLCLCDLELFWNLLCIQGGIQVFPVVQIQICIWLWLCTLPR